MSTHSPFELAVPVREIDHSRGPAHAHVTLVEYGDFECPNCKQAAPVLKSLLARFPKELRVVYRHFPLEGVHPHALRAAEASECAAGQGKFWEMHDLLIENQLHLKTNNLRSYAERLELDLERYDYEMKDEVYLQRVREHIAGAEASGVRGTPAFFINGKLQDVSYGLQLLVKAVEAAAQR